MKINIVVCDDKNTALKMNCRYIEELAKKYKADAGITGFLSGEKVLEHMEHNEIDMVFLDINLNGLNGIDIAAELLKKNSRVIIIFITAHREFAFDAFTVEAFGYLVKPVDPDRLERVFRKAVMQVNDINNRQQRVPLIITEDNIKRKISQTGILYIERAGSRSVIYTRTARHPVYETVTSLIGRLEDNFLRISQGIIVNLEEVAGIQGHLVTMKTGEVFSIGRTYSKDVKEKYPVYLRV